MKIQTGQVILGSQQSSVRRQLQQADVRIQEADANPPPTNNDDLIINGVAVQISNVTAPTAATTTTQVDLIALNQQASQRRETQQAASLTRVTQMDAGTQVLLSHFNLLETVSSVAMDQRLQLTSGNVMQPPTALSAGATMQLNAIQTFEQTLEQTDRLTTEALGSVITEDGRQIDFLLQLDFERSSTVTQQMLLQQRNVNFIDPLVINLNGEPPSLADATFEFDLDADGETETISQTAAGTGFIAFDQNQNGIIDNGSELFGPQTGSGFTELAQYDEDGNGWIDENDSAYWQLSFMDFSPDGTQRLRSLQNVDIGAIYLGSTQSQWNLEDSDGNFQAQMQRSGFALREDGQALAVQEIYYTKEMEQFSAPSFTFTQVSDAPAARSFSEEALGRLNQLNQQVQQQQKTAYVPSFEPLTNTEPYTDSSNPDFTLQPEIQHLRWLDEDTWVSEHSQEEIKLEYLRDLIQDLRDQREYVAKNQEKLTAAYQGVLFASDP